MKNFWVSFCYVFPAVILFLLTPVSIAQLSPSENRILFQIQKLLEYPQVLQGWTNWTNFCYLPPSPSLWLVCSNAHIIEISITGNKGSPSHSPRPASWNSPETLSERFSIDSLFTDLTKLSSLKVLSLVSLGLWGPLPDKINRFWSLEVLNISSNFIYGQIPSSVSSLKTLRNLVLADNLFNGSVPELKSVVSLEELNLSNNKLGPEFPSVSNNLVSIILRNNSLKFKIPSQLNRFNRLQRIDISSNEIFGTIPSFLFSLPSIQYLNLAENRLSGNLSVNTACNAALTSVDISHNLLVGKLPPCIGLKSANRTVVYSWNCLSDGKLSYQHPSSYCKKEEAIAVKPPRKSQNQKESSMKLGLILGIIGGCVGIAALLAVFVLFILKKSKAEREKNKNLEGYVGIKFSSRASPGPNIDPRRVPQTMRLATVELPPHQIFTAEEIEDATNNFDPSNLIREGSQGQIYKGWIRDGSVVLVRSIKVKQKNLPQSLVQQLEVLPKLRHRHLESVLGHCVVTYLDHPHSTSTVFIVFEHINNGSLRDHLADWRRNEKLKWPQRMAISIGIARGIQFLHNGIAPGIFGNNLKIENVLLDDSLNARVSEYNIHLPSKSTLTEQNGLMSNEEAEKEDIYQLGVILLQIITGKPITSANAIDEQKLKLERGLSETASALRGVADPSIRGSFAYESLRTAVQITISCLSKVSSQRPSIEDILWHLQYSMQVQEAWTSSGSLSGNFSGNLSGNLGARY